MFILDQNGLVVPPSSNPISNVRNDHDATHTQGDERARAIAVTMKKLNYHHLRQSLTCSLLGIMK